MASASISDTPKAFERRSGRPALRIPIQLPVELFTNGKATLNADAILQKAQGPEMALNVSTGGMFIRTTRYLSPGTQVKVSFCLFGSEWVETQARVVWASEGVVGNTTRFARGIGIEFVGLPPATQKQLQQFTLLYRELP